MAELVEVLRMGNRNGARTAPTARNLRWAAALVNERDLSRPAKLVGLVCALKYANWETLGDIRPGVPNLARDTSTSPRTVQRALNELVRAGYLEIAKRGSYGRATLYVGRFGRASTASREERLCADNSARRVLPQLTDSVDRCVHGTNTDVRNERKLST